MYRGCNAGCGRESHRLKILKYYAESGEKQLAQFLRRLTFACQNRRVVPLFTDWRDSRKVAGRVFREMGDSDPGGSIYQRSLAVSLSYHVALRLVDLEVCRSVE